MENQPVPTSVPELESVEDVDVGTEFEVDRSELFSNDESATIDQARIEDLKPVASIAEATQYASVQDMLGDEQESLRCFFEHTSAKYNVETTNVAAQLNQSIHLLRVLFQISKISQLENPRAASRVGDGR